MDNQEATCNDCNTSEYETSVYEDENGEFVCDSCMDGRYWDDIC